MNDFLTAYRQRFEQIYPKYLPTNTDHIGSVYDAIHYSFEAGGKRLRPALVYALADSLCIPLEQVDAVAIAVEAIHTYSLIHDDLPDMDDDHLRRGKPSCHKQFDPATAILAGDALNTLAFEILAKDNKIAAEKRLRQIAQLAHGAGIDGMVGGQDTDLTCENLENPIDLTTLSNLHQRKTAKLIEACLLMTYFSIDTMSAEKAELLSKAALSLGLLYQIQDDVLDVTKSSKELGKPASSDILNHKSTYVSLLGLEGAVQAASETAKQIEQQLSTFFAPQSDYHKTSLAMIIEKIIQRNH